MDKHYLTPLFEPQSIALFTGPQDQPELQTPQAQALLAHMKAKPFKGHITPLDTRTVGTLADLAKTRADLAIIALPEDEIIPALELAGRIRAKAALVLGDNINMEKARSIHEIARRYGMSLLGPNSQGIQRPSINLNASTSGNLAAPGQLALVTQSGALTASILDWAEQNKVGFSTVVALGRYTQVNLASTLDYFASDRLTQGVVIHMEGIHDARRFTSALRQTAGSKPVVVLKAGHHANGNSAAQTHSGAIVGSDAVFETVLRRAGAVRVQSFV
jgi:acetyltransferase